LWWLMTNTHAREAPMDLAVVRRRRASSGGPWSNHRDRPRLPQAPPRPSLLANDAVRLRVRSPELQSLACRPRDRAARRGSNRLLRLPRVTAAAGEKGDGGGPPERLARSSTRDHEPAHRGTPGPVRARLLSGLREKDPVPSRVVLAGCKHGRVVFLATSATASREETAVSCASLAPPARVPRSA
jgi:hypothetical protein